MNVPYIDPAMLERIVPTREVIDGLGEYFVTPHKYEPVEPIASNVLGLNPRAWPPCKHCGGNVNCEAYDPDTSAGLWEQSK